MNLDIIRYVGEVLDLYESKKNIYKLISEEITDFISEHVLDKCDGGLSVSYRIKTADSLREKLIRNNYISKYGDNAAVLANIQDIIGIRIECQFIDDEAGVFERLKTIFCTTMDDVYYSTPNFPKLRLKLGEHQPQTQKNGFSIYKIDGEYTLGSEVMRFELQIKAMVNLFWSEIEHRLMYKNHSYMMNDDYVNDLMYSVKMSLNMIDNQLHVLYRQYRRENSVGDHSRKEAAEKMISKMIYDVFSEMMHTQLGFTISFRNSCDTIVAFLMRNTDNLKLESYSGEMFELMRCLADAKNDPPDLDKIITLDPELLHSEDIFTACVAKTVYELINTDYNWHLFFEILFRLGNDAPEKLIMDFIAHYRSKVFETSRLQAIRKDIFNSITQHIGDVFMQKKRLDMFFDKGIAIIHNAINTTLDTCERETLTDANAWEHSSSRFIAAGDRVLDEIK